MIQRERTHTREVADRIKRINELLGQYGDTGFVREHDLELRELRTQLTQSGKLSFESKLQSLYGPEIRFPGNAKVLLEYVCTSEEALPWLMGDWKRGVDGWSAERQHSRADLEDETLWPRLLLEEPLDLNAAMSVEIEFEQPQSSGPPKNFVVSVAGVHIGFAGPTEQGLKSQVAAKAGGVDALKELLDQLGKGKGSPINGLERGKTYKLRVDLAQGRGRLTATLNGEPLLRGQDSLRPEGKGGSYSIVVRSLEPVLLKAVRIDAGVRR